MQERVEARRRAAISGTFHARGPHAHWPDVVSIEDYRLRKMKMHGDLHPVLVGRSGRKRGCLALSRLRAPRSAAMVLYQTCVC
jgi:hypothetical protein